MGQAIVSDSDRRPIRILHLGNPVGLYGAERWILALVKHLPRDRVASWVGVIQDAPGPEAPLLGRARQLGFEVQEFVSYGKLSWSAITQMRRFIVQNEIDVLHTHGYKTDILGRLATRRTRCLNVSTPHGWTVNADLQLRLYEWLDRLCYGVFDAVVPLSEDLYTGLRRMPGLNRKLHLIPNGIDLSEIEAIANLAEPVRSWRSQGYFVLGYIGRLVGGKRIDTLLRALHRLNGTRMKLCVIGEGPELGNLKALAAELGESDRVAFLGYREDRIALLRGFDVFVLPSASEGIPRCLMEAMGAGVACIASDIPGCRYLIEPEVSGLLAPVGDDGVLASHIEDLAQRPDRRDRFAKFARRHVHESHSAQTMATEYLALYRRMLGPERLSASHRAVGERP